MIKRINILLVLVFICSIEKISANPMDDMRGCARPSIEFMARNMDHPMEGPHGRKGHGGRKSHRGGRRIFGDLEAMKEHLDLEDKQIEKISEINDKYGESYKEKKDIIRPKHRELSNLLLKKEIDLKKVEKLLREISDIKVDLKMLRIKHRIEIEKVLTDEQKKKLKEINKKRREEFKGRFHHGPKHGRHGGPERERNRW